ncbi:uncharacterized protein [Palaemon carinicauda]|uniref:uncharacterized protein n=1 Tax=Palaemon carinicauda TaxID=392227 RepID=UPI0035B5DB10
MGNPPRWLSFKPNSDIDSITAAPNRYFQERSLPVLDPSPQPMRIPPAKKKKNGTTVKPPTATFTATLPTSTPTTEEEASAMDLDPSKDTRSPALAEAHQPDCNCTSCLTQLLATLTPTVGPTPDLAKATATLTLTVEPSPKPGPTPKNPEHQPQFKLPSVEGVPSYAAVVAIATSNPGIKISARVNLKGDIIITTKDQDSASLFHKETSQAYLDPAEKLRKAVVSNYSVKMPLIFITDCSNVAHAERYLGCHKQPTRKVTVIFIGPIPLSLDLRLWGIIPIEDIDIDPLRCFNCERFRHHKENCRNSTMCGVCSRWHPTQECIDTYKDGLETHPKCPKCGGSHHAWNRRCPEEFRRLRALQNVPYTTAAAAKTQLPKP